MKNKFSLFGVLFGTLLVSGLFVASCNKDDNDNNGNKGTDPSTIASSNLIAYFPFEEEGEEVQFSNNTITFDQAVGNAQLVTGRRGNAYQGDTTESYFKYNVASGTALKTLDEISLACWIKTPHTTGGAAKIFAINGGDPFMGALTLLQESQPLGDSVDMKFYLFDSESPDWKGQDIRNQSSSFVNDMWFHLVALYNKTTSSMEFYANGELVYTSVKYAGPVPTEGDQPLLGPIKLGQDMNEILIGAWPQQIDGTEQDWMTYFRGMVDELRIYNKALTPQEIKDLYEAEVSKID